MSFVFLRRKLVFKPKTWSPSTYVVLARRALLLSHCLLPPGVPCSHLHRRPCGYSQVLVKIFLNDLNIIASPLPASGGHMFQDPRWVPKSTDSTETHILLRWAFTYTRIPSPCMAAPACPDTQCRVCSVGLLPEHENCETGRADLITPTVTE